jgi:hypothetical protein
VGLIAKLVSFARGDVASSSKIDKGGGYNNEAQHYAPAGDDSYPMPGDSAAAITTQGTGKIVVVGYVDLNNEQKAELGEKRIYARDSGGMGIVELWLKADGSAVIENHFVSISLLADGSINLNGVTIDPTGAVSVPASLKVAGKEVNGHAHAGVTSGPSSTDPF